MATSTDDTRVIDERIDKNGTKHQEIDTKCDRCGGAGQSDKWLFTGKVCYKCGGSGRMRCKRKIYTPEHEEKLRKRRERAAERKREKAILEAKLRNEELFRKWGYENGKIYAVLGSTYNIREELKEEGAIWGDQTIGWYFSTKPEKWETVELDVSELVWYNDLGEVHQKGCLEYKDYVNEQKRLNELISDWVGSAGDKVDMELRVVGSSYITYDNPFAYGTITLYMNKMRDSKGNVFIWQTAKNLSNQCDSEGKVRLRGTIKEHITYQNQKQTVLTRCRVSKQGE
ncbi:hypothetical protein MOD96_02380 [Bacillus sp. S17B2]|uniref:hypothetical protein n=1 Tax=Bacillus sp. S17B2 TaxID=2918907 RepID=UPI00227DBE3D|nr:hypothetical protein [Bacillus sp. S17B2]